MVYVFLLCIVKKEIVLKTAFNPEISGFRATERVCLRNDYCLDFLGFGEAIYAAKNTSYGQFEGILGLALSESSQSSPMAAALPTVCFSMKYNLKIRTGVRREEGFPPFQSSCDFIFAYKLGELYRCRNCSAMYNRPEAFLCSQAHHYNRKKPPDPGEITNDIIPLRMVAYSTVGSTSSF